MTDQPTRFPAVAQLALVAILAFLASAGAAFALMRTDDSAAAASSGAGSPTSGDTADSESAAPVGAVEWPDWEWEAVPFVEPHTVGPVPPPAEVFVVDDPGDEPEVDVLLMLHEEREAALPRVFVPVPVDDPEGPILGAGPVVVGPADAAGSTDDGSTDDPPSDTDRPSDTDGPDGSGDPIFHVMTPPVLPVADDEPVLDVCADVEGWCDLGVGGTVTLALDSPLAILDVDTNPSSECVAALGTVRRDATLFRVITDRPGRLHTYVHSGDRRRLDSDLVSTRDAEVERWEAERAVRGTEVVPAETCVALDLQGSTERLLYVVVTGSSLTRAGESEWDDTWSGWVPVLRGDRPPVRVRPRTDATIGVEVPVTNDQVSDLAVVPVGDRTPSADLCDATSDDWTPRPRAARVPTGIHLGADPAYRTIERFWVGLTEPGTYMLCIRWRIEALGEGDHAVVETKAIAVRPPVRPEVSFHVGDFEPVYRADAADPSLGFATVPSSMSVSVTQDVFGIECADTFRPVGWPASRVEGESGWRPPAQPYVELCSLQWTESLNPIGLNVVPRFDGATRPIPTRVAIRPALASCAGIDPCQLVHRLRVMARPPEGSGDVRPWVEVGHVNVVVMVGDMPVWDEWEIETIDGENRDRPSSPVLLPSSRLRTPDPDECRSETDTELTLCWARTVLFEWQADRPVEIVELRLFADDDGLPVDWTRSEICPAQVSGRRSTTVEVAGGVVTFDGLCPGTGYHLALVLEDIETGEQTRYLPLGREPDLDEASEDDVPVALWNGSVHTPAVRAYFDWEVSTLAFDHSVSDRARNHAKVLNLVARVDDRPFLRTGETRGEDHCGRELQWNTGDAKEAPRPMYVGGSVRINTTAEFRYTYDCNDYRRNVGRAFNIESARIENTDRVVCSRQHAFSRLTEGVLNPRSGGVRTVLFTSVCAKSWGSSDGRRGVASMNFGTLIVDVDQGPSPRGGTVEVVGR